MKTAQQAAANWAGSQTRAVQAYTQGVQAYNGDWVGATIAQEQTLLLNVTAAIQNGSWRQGVSRVTTAGWKAATEAKSPNYGQGFQAGAQRQATAIGKIMTALGNIVPNLPQRGTYEQNKLRATTLMDNLHALRGQLGA